MNLPLYFRLANGSGTGSRDFLMSPPLTNCRLVWQNSYMYQIPDEQFQKLTIVAHAAGYEDVPALITSLAEEAVDDPRGTLSPEQLQQSLAQCDRSMAEFDAGRGRDAEEAFLEFGRDRGYDLGE